MPIVCLTRKLQTARQSNGVLKGCRSVVLPNFDETDKIIAETIASFKESGEAKVGDAFVVVHGAVAKEGATNTMKIEYA
jgi:pyruvate kinase